MHRRARTVRTPQSTAPLPASPSDAIKRGAPDVDASRPAESSERVHLIWPGQRDERVLSGQLLIAALVTGSILCSDGHRNQSDLRHHAPH